MTDTSALRTPSTSPDPAAIAELRRRGHPRPSGAIDVDLPAWLAHGAGVAIVDVREPAEFEGELGHLAGAELVPLATLASAAAGWARDRPILTVCRSGGRSAVAADSLAALGFTRVFNLLGGMLGVRAHAAGPDHA